MLRALKQLDGTSYNSEANKRIKGIRGNYYPVRNINHRIYSTAIISDPGEPNTIWEAMNGDEKEQWIPSIKSEVMNFINRKSWEYVSITEPKDKNRKLIPCKWVFKIKNEQDGSKRYKSRLCVKGFHQIPGVDYTESFSPVATESTINILLLYTLWKCNEGWKCEMFDVEAAFLNAELETAMYLKWPDAMHELGFISKHQLENECIKLVRSMYGNVDAALRWQKCFVKTCIDPEGEIQCEQSQVDPCLLFKRNEEGQVVLLIVCYVDDVLLSGTIEEIKKFKEQFKRKYKITELGNMKKHLGMWYEWNSDEEGPYIKVTMDAMLEDIIYKYKETTGQEVSDQVSPGYPNKCLKKTEEESKIVKEKEYRSLVGKILYYVNKMDIPCSNAIRELAQHLDSPSEEHWKALKRIVGYLKTRIGKGKMLRRPKELRIIGWSDSDYAKAEDRASITGNLSSVGGSVVYGSSKGQKCVCLSSTEAEYVAMSTLAQEIRFEQQLLDEIAGNEHKYPSIIYEDNVGAIFLSQNRQVGQRTKHIDVREHFIRRLVENDQVEVKFVKSEDNHADILTKNVKQELFDKHSAQINTGKLDYEVTEGEKVMMTTRVVDEQLEETQSEDHEESKEQNQQRELEQIENDDVQDSESNEDVESNHESDDSEMVRINDQENIGQEMKDEENNSRELDVRSRSPRSVRIIEDEISRTMLSNSPMNPNDYLEESDSDDSPWDSPNWRPIPMWYVEQAERDMDVRLAETNSGEQEVNEENARWIEAVNQTLERSDRQTIGEYQTVGQMNPWYTPYGNQEGMFQRIEREMERYDAQLISRTGRNRHPDYRDDINGLEWGIYHIISEREYRRDMEDDDSYFNERGDYVRLNPRRIWYDYMYHDTQDGERKEN